jgi:proteasome lid subunit RPN8/RPN11
MNWTSNARPQVLITPLAFQKLRLYIELCPMEIGGLGEVERHDSNLMITDLFILPQKISPAETELDPAAIFEILQCCIAEGRDPASLCLWWHSHADMDVEWSAADRRTIENFPGDFMLSLVGNKAGDFACRLDIRHPIPQVLGDLGLAVLPGPDGEGDEAALRTAIIAEMVEKLQVITRDLQYHEIPVEVEFLSPFPPELCPPESFSDDR